MLKIRNAPNVWSMIMTIFGDVVLPRGGVVPTATLLDILGLFEIGSGAARTALSRLVADDWLESDRAGRRSSYRLTSRGQAQTLAASQRIYRGPEAQQALNWEVAVAFSGALDSASRNAARSRAVSLDFIHLTADTMARPSASEPDAVLVHLPGFCLMRSEMAQAEEARVLLTQSTEMQALSQAYTQFLQTYDTQPDQSAKLTISPSEALISRLQIVHDYRRIALKDPDFHHTHLPLKWPGLQVRKLMARKYHALVPQSELWLDEAGLAYPQDGAVGRDIVDQRFH